MLVDYTQFVFDEETQDYFWEPKFVRGKRVDEETVEVPLGIFCSRVLGSALLSGDKKISDEEFDKRNNLRHNILEAMRLKQPLDTNEKDRALLQKLIRENFALSVSAPCCGLLTDKPTNVVPLKEPANG